MKMDLIVMGIFVLTLIVCAIKGFVRTLIGFLKGVVSLVVSFIFCDNLSEYLTTKTKIGENIAGRVNEFLSEKWASSPTHDSIPKLFQGIGDNFATNLIDNNSGKIANIILTIACFFIIWIGIKLVLGLISLLFSKKHNDGAIKKTDTALGIFLGIVIGLFYVYLFLALLIPVTGFIIPGKAEIIFGWFDGSIISKWLYDNNLLLALLKGVLLKN